MKYYIAGPMSGRPNYNRDKFLKAEMDLLDTGAVVLNPACLPSGLSQPEYMDICFAMIRASTHIMMLRGWKESEGATAEYYYAKKLGLTISFQ